MQPSTLLRAFEGFAKVWYADGAPVRRLEPDNWARCLHLEEWRPLDDLDDEDGGFLYTIRAVPYAAIFGEGLDELDSSSEVLRNIAEMSPAALRWVDQVALRVQPKTARVFELGEVSDYATNSTAQPRRPLSPRRPPKLSAMDKVRRMANREAWDPERVARMPRLTSSHHFAINPRKRDF